jgi:negative regulator of flagellin synthesis FlgM
MNDITAVRGPSVTPVNGLEKPAAAQTASPTRLRRTDEAEISIVGQMLSRLSDLPVRQEMIDRVRQEIAAGTYETPEKMQAAMEGLMEDVS